MNIKEIIVISRPRFWIYELGTYFIGVITAIGSLSGLLDPAVLIFALFFLLPANILIYGINDIFDYETDKLNPKKVEYEALLVPEKHKTVWKYIFFTTIPFVVFSLFVLSWEAIIAIGFFIFFAVFYSAKPIRAKARPVLDSLFSAGHYIATGVFGYYLVGGTSFPMTPVIAGMCWAVAMHAYSAVPDIKADSDAQLETIATRLGGKNTILLCIALYGLVGILLFPFIGIFSIIIGLVYMGLMIRSLYTKTDTELFKIYTFFPWVNTIVPMIWTIVYMIQKFSTVF